MALDTELQKVTREGCDSRRKQTIMIIFPRKGNILAKTNRGNNGLYGRQIHWRSAAQKLLEGYPCC